MTQSLNQFLITEKFSNIMGLENLAFAVPEMFLTFASMMLLMFGTYFKPKNHEKLYCYIVKTAIAVLAISACFYIRYSQDLLDSKSTYMFSNLMVSNAFTSISKICIIIAAISMLFVNLGSYKKEKICNNYEFPILLIFSVIGMMVMISSNDFLTLYMGIELQSLCLYVMAAWHRDNSLSSEAAVKYFVLGAVASGFLLFGISLIYGFTATTNFSVVSTYFVMNDSQEMAVLVGMIFILVAMFFKISAAPFHMWAPDVYQGAPVTVTSYFATVPKIAATLLLTKLLFGVFAAWVDKWQQILIFTSLLSMIIGSLAAIRQKNIKRLMAYSSIGHVGFILLAIASAASSNIYSVIAYLIIYAMMNLGVFALIHLMRRSGERFENISYLSGISKTNPIFAMSMLVFMFSMSGIPPLAGFFAKYYVMMSAVNQSLYYLVVVAAVSSVISAFYYLRIIKIMYFNENEHGAIDCDISPIMKFILIISVIFNICFFLIQDHLLYVSFMAQKSFLN